MILTVCLFLPEMKLVSACRGRAVEDRKTCLFHNSSDNQRWEHLIEPAGNTNERNELESPYTVRLEKTVIQHERLPHNCRLA